MLMTLTSSVEHKKYIKISSGNYRVWAEWILDYEQYKYPEDLDMVSKLIVDNLEMKFCPPRYRDENMGNPLFGHCYHATQALYYFFKDTNLKAFAAPNIIDITAGQYEAFGIDPPYDKGKETKWYGWKNRPHRKSQNLMKLVQPSANLYFKQYEEKPKKVY